MNNLLENTDSKSILNYIYNIIRVKNNAIEEQIDLLFYTQSQKSKYKVIFRRGTENGYIYIPLYYIYKLNRCNSPLLVSINNENSNNINLKHEKIDYKDFIIYMIISFFIEGDWNLNINHFVSVFEFLHTYISTGLSKLITFINKILSEQLKYGIRDISSNILKFLKYIYIKYSNYIVGNLKWTIKYIDYEFVYNKYYTYDINIVKKRYNIFKFIEKLLLIYPYQLHEIYKDYGKHYLDSKNNILKIKEYHKITPIEDIQKYENNKLYNYCILDPSKIILYNGHNNHYSCYITTVKHVLDTYFLDIKDLNDETIISLENCLSMYYYTEYKKKHNYAGYIQKIYYNRSDIPFLINYIPKCLNQINSFENNNIFDSFISFFQLKI